MMTYRMVALPYVEYFVTHRRTVRLGRRDLAYTILPAFLTYFYRSRYARSAERCEHEFWRIPEYLTHTMTKSGAIHRSGQVAMTL